MKSTTKTQKKETTKSKVDILKDAIKQFSDSIHDGFVYPLIIPPLQSIDEDILFEIYPDLRLIGKQKNLHILLYSYGGDAHTAFHIGRLLQSYASDQLIIYVLREAKSAATLISCAADKIIFSEISELGPMDPQIRSSFDNERFSPLAIKHVFELLHDETKLGHTSIAQTLTNKLPEPLRLGELLKSLETGKDYLCKLLSARMFKEDEESKIKTIAEKLVTGYPDHGYCIDFTEAVGIGLKVEKVPAELEDVIFSIMQSYKTVWDEFDSLYIKARRDKTEPQDAFLLYANLKELAKNVVDYQKSRRPVAPVNKKEN